jgi:mRNA-degrading endonuclease toxin of MazEF toxin-antitoxin module
MTDTPSSGDVWLVRFRFLDKPELSKVRPAVVVATDETCLFVSAAKVTSHAPRDVEGDLALVDWLDEGLAKPSCVRCSQVIEIPFELLFRRLGRLSENDMRRFCTALRQLGVVEK